MHPLIVLAQKEIRKAILNCMKGALSVLTFNSWLLRTPLGIDLAKDIDERVRRLPQRVAALQPDIILLQEIWHSPFRKLLADEFLRVGYPYSTEPRHHGWLRMGDGLQIISRFELDSLKHHSFSIHTRFDERFVEKGAIKVRVKVPQLGWIDIYNSHLGAVTYNTKKREFHRSQCESRYVQSLELKKWILETRTSETAILGVDLNVHRLHHENGVYLSIPSKEFALMITGQPHGAGFVDTFSQLNGTENHGGCTFHNSNPYRASGYFGSDPCATLDYLFLANTSPLVPVSSEVVLDKPALSDHYGVLTTFE